MVRVEGRGEGVQGESGGGRGGERARKEGGGGGWTGRWRGGEVAEITLGGACGDGCVFWGQKGGISNCMATCFFHL